MDDWKTTFLLGSSIFRGYVSFREGRWAQATPPFFWNQLFIQAPTPKSAGHEVSKEVAIRKTRPEKKEITKATTMVGLTSPTWMSREVDGSMASNWVISPTFINGVYWGYKL